MYFCEKEKGDFSLWCDAVMYVVKIFLSVSQSLCVNVGVRVWSWIL